MTLFHTVIPHTPNRTKGRICPYRKHQIVWSLLNQEDKPERDFIFWVKEITDHLEFHMITSERIQPEWGEEIPTPQSGDEVKWRILANPVKKQGNKKIPIQNVSEAETWLKNRMRGIESPTIKRLHFLPPEKAYKKGKPIIIHQMEAAGGGKVNNPEELLTITKNGIGPSRAFGYGAFLWKLIRKKQP